MSDLSRVHPTILVNFKIEPQFIPETDLKPTGTMFSGGFGDVWQCLMSTPAGTQQLVAVKCIRVHSVPDDQALQRAGLEIRREAYVWIKLQHDHILPLMGMTVIERFGLLPALVSPWMEEGSLDGYLMREFSNLSDPRKRELVCQVASGLSYLHDNDIVHGNLTPVNILVDGSGSIRIGDFGQSIILTELGNVTFDFNNCGNVRWMPPECFIDDEDARTRPAKPWDIYSYGCVMLQILSGKQPYATYTSPLRVMSAILRGHAPFDTTQSHGEYGELSMRCLHKTPAERPTIDNIISVLGVLSNISATRYPVQRLQDVHQAPPAVDDFSGRSDVQYPPQQLEDVRPAVPAVVENPPDHRHATPAPSHVLRHFPSFPPYQPDVDVAPNVSLNPRRRFLSLCAPSARTVGKTTPVSYVAPPPNPQTTRQREAPTRATTPLPLPHQPLEVSTTTTYLPLPPPPIVLPSITSSADTPALEQIGCCSRLLHCIRYCIRCTICSVAAK